MPNQIPIECGHYFHIYNHSNGNDKIFYSNENYKYFLLKYKELISPIADTFAYCLMPNHFHFLVRIIEEEPLFNWLRQQEKIPDETLTLTSLKALSANSFNILDIHISKQFSRFFSGFAQAINKQENRLGSLFTRQFKRKKIASEKQLRDTLIYIHNNPIHHGFVANIENWEHSSFHTFLSDKPTMLLREEAIGWFENKENFLFCHKYYSDVLIEEND